MEKTSHFRALAAISAVAVVAGIIGALALRGPRSNAAPRTMRIDYQHEGDAAAERFAVERFVLEPLDWPGGPEGAIDGTNLGKYFFQIVDGATQRILYSRGFASIYGEWETTGEAKEKRRAFSESLRFPAPPGPVQIVVHKRDAANAFREIWRVPFDPKTAPIDRAPSPSPGPLLEIEKHGPSAEKVDFLILGDGYTPAERGKFEQDARRLVAILFSKSPFRERRADFNVWGLCPAASESGIARPSTGVARHSPVGATYDALGSERYILTFENRAMRDVAAFAPYEFVEILTNSDTYGGGGILQTYSTVAADSAWSAYIFIHEFGHHFAGLADEYYTSDVAYEPAADRVEPWEPNVTSLRDRGLKWLDLASPGVAIPTDWSKEAYEAEGAVFERRRRQIRAERRPEAEMDALFREQEKAEERLIASDAHAREIGAFEGAHYEAKGFYRPQEDCVMFRRSEIPFCAVCQRAIGRVIDLYTPRRTP